MKGIHGLILAIGLGIAGALFNFAYLANRSRDVEKVAFIGVKEDKIIGRGELLVEESLEPVEIPRRWVGKLEDYAFLWSTRATVVGRRAWRALEGGSLLMRADLKTPPQELVFGVNLEPGIVKETAIGVPIDTRKFVTSLVQPGDMVSFIVSAGRTDSPTLAEPPAKPEAAGKADAKDGPALAAARAKPRDTIDKCGPFKVLSIGNRLGSYDVMTAARIPQSHENVMTILVRYYEGDKMDPEAAKLMRILQQTGSQPLAYELHPRTEKKE
jgi:hypothetical protein